VSPVGKLVTSVAATHAEALEFMRPWSRLAKGGRPRMLRDLLAEAGTNDGKALVRLFQLYCQRPAIWRRCLKGAEFAAFEKAMRSEFTTVYSDMKQVQTFYTLTEWEQFIEYDDFGARYYPVCVGVRMLDDRFRVVSFVRLSSVKESKKEQLIAIAKQLQGINGFRGKNVEDPSRVTMKRVENLTLEQAKEEAVSQMRTLEKEFKAVL